MRLIKLLRSFLGISRKELSEVSGVSVRELTRIEQGESIPTPRTLAEIDTAFNQMLRDRLVEGAQ